MSRQKKPRKSKPAKRKAVEMPIDAPFRKVSRHNQFSRQIIMGYFSSIGFTLLALIAGVVIARIFATMVIWQGTDPLYRDLKAIEDRIFLIGGIVGIVVCLRVGYKKISNLTGFLEELIHASEQLATASDEPIRLSEELIDVQSEMNIVRERAIRSAYLAKEAEQRKNDLIVYLAHDLKTPLTSVIGYLTLLRDEPEISTALRSRYTGIALDKAERLEDLINEFFDITRFNLTTLTLELEPINLGRMVEQIANEFNPILAEKDLRWEASIEPSVELLCDPDKLERAFDNLIRNAINYSYVASPIQLSLRTVGDRVEIHIQNRGKTIAPDKLDRLFDQFFRLDSSRSSSTGGAGLGLAISKEIVELHGGIIRADSANEMIRFTVVLPLNPTVS